MLIPQAHAEIVKVKDFSLSTNLWLNVVIIFHISPRPEMQWEHTAVFELRADIDMHISSPKVSRQVEHLKMIKTDAVIGQSPRVAHRTGYGRI